MMYMLNMSTDIINNIIEFLPNNVAKDVNVFGRILVKNRSAVVLQRSYRRWLHGMEYATIRTRIKKYVPIMFRQSFRNFLAISVSLTKCNTLSFIWSSESHRLMLINNDLTTNDIKFIHINGSRFVESHYNEVRELKKNIMDRVTLHAVTIDIDIYTITEDIIREFIKQHNGPTDEVIITDIIFRIQESITSDILQEITRMINNMSLIQLVDVACDIDIANAMMG